MEAHRHHPTLLANRRKDESGKTLQPCEITITSTIIGLISSRGDLEGRDVNCRTRSMSSSSEGLGIKPLDQRDRRYVVSLLQNLFDTQNPPQSHVSSHSGHQARSQGGRLNDQIPTNPNERPPPFIDVRVL